MDRLSGAPSRACESDSPRQARKSLTPMNRTPVLAINNESEFTRDLSRWRGKSMRSALAFVQPFPPAQLSTEVAPCGTRDRGSIDVPVGLRRVAHRSARRLAAFNTPPAVDEVLSRYLERGPRGRFYNQRRTGLLLALLGHGAHPRVWPHIKPHRASYTPRYQPSPYTGRHTSRLSCASYTSSRWMLGTAYTIGTSGLIVTKTYISSFGSRAGPGMPYSTRQRSRLRRPHC